MVSVAVAVVHAVDTAEVLAVAVAIAEVAVEVVIVEETAVDTVEVAAAEIAVAIAVVEIAMIVVVTVVTAVIVVVVTTTTEQRTNFQGTLPQLVEGFSFLRGGPINVKTHHMLKEREDRVVQKTIKPKWVGYFCAPIEKRTN